MVQEGFPVFVMLLDTYCEEERIECMKNAIMTSLDVLPPESLIGIISFDERVFFSFECTSKMDMDLGSIV